MANHITMVTAKRKAKSESKGHTHPVKRVSITPTDNGGFAVEVEHHATNTEREYMPGEVKTAAFDRFSKMHKHIAMMLKTDAEEQGPGEGKGGDPGSSEAAE